MKMRLTTRILGIATVALLPSAEAADHRDGPKVRMDASTDINDVYAWTNAAGKLELIMTVSPLADGTSKFSDAALYTFHVNSMAGFGAPQTETTIVCSFDAAATQAVSCWAGTDASEYVTGDASAAEGIASPSGKFKVHAGLHDDPFFFNLEGFNDARTTVLGAAAALMFDAAGCPAVDAATSGAVVGMLQGTAFGSMPAANFFAGLNVLAIVVEVDPSLVNSGGPVLGVWASTNSK